MPLDATDKLLLNLLQSSFPLEREPFAVGRPPAPSCRWTRFEPAPSGCSTSGSSARSRPIFDTRALGYASMLVAAKVDSENPQRAARIINSHPGVSHNYLRTHEFNLWFTIATPPDSELGLEGTLEVLRAETGAESIRQLPTLTLFKINMNLEMEQGTEALAATIDASPPRELEAQPYDDTDVAVIRALQGPMAVIGPPLRRRGRARRDAPRPVPGAPERDGGAKAPAAGGGDPLPPAGRVLGQRDGGVAGA